MKYRSKVALCIICMLLSGCAEFNETMHSLAQMNPPGRLGEPHNSDSRYRATQPLDVRTNAYGPGIGSDQYGRPIEHDPNLQYTPNVYGPGIGSDQYGRPVQLSPGLSE